jgi:hypothetical protein
VEKHSTTTKEEEEERGHHHLRAISTSHKRIANKFHHLL